jgi:transformer-2 protein
MEKGRRDRESKHSARRSRSRERRSSKRRSSRSEHRSRSRSEHRARSRSETPRPRRSYEDHDNPDPNKCLGVFGLHLRTRERDLKELFSAYGQVTNCTIIVDVKSQRSRGFGFVYFATVEQARLAKESCNGMKVDGKIIRVDFSVTQRPHTPTPGIYMGQPRRHRPRDTPPRSSYRPAFRRSPSPYEDRYRRRRRSRSRSYSPRGRYY